MSRIKKVVLIKIGSRFFSKGWFLRLWRLTGEIAKFQKAGHRFVIVSSGAVSFGKKVVPPASKSVQAMVG